MGKLGYCGPAWLHRGLCEFLLTTQRIQWSDILFRFVPRVCLPADVFREPMAEIVEAAQAVDGEALGKQLANSLIGFLVCRDASLQWRTQTSTCVGDRPDG